MPTVSKYSEATADLICDRCNAQLKAIRELGR